MAQKGLVLGFYQHRDSAESALASVRKMRLGRAALIRRALKGRVYVNDRDISPRRGAFIGTAVGLIAAAAVLTTRVHVGLIAGPSGPIVVSIAAAVIGALIGLLAARAVDLGVPDRTLREYESWLVAGESAVVVTSLPKNMAAIVEILRATAGDQPVTFAFHAEGTRTPQVLDDAPELRRGHAVRERLTSDAARLAAELHTTDAAQPKRKTLTRRIGASEALLNSVRALLAEGSRVGQSTTMAAEWLLDNFYLVQGHIDEVRVGLPRQFYRELPLISAGPLTGLPRAYGLAAELVADSDAKLDRTNVFDFLQAYQSVEPLTIAELWAVPLMLRMRLLECLSKLGVDVDRRQRERELADFYANRLLTASRRDTDRLIEFVANLSRRQPEPTAHFGEQLISNLFDEDDAMLPVRGWLERKLNGPIGSIVQSEHNDQAAELVSLSNCISSLRTLSQLDWRDMFEACCRVDAILYNDPTNVFLQMDFATRDRYRNAIEQMARQAKKSEVDVAFAAVRLADEGSDDVSRHVGFYLVDAGRPALEAVVDASVPATESLRRMVRAHGAGFYLTSVAILTASIVAGVLVTGYLRKAPADVLVIFAIMALIPISEIAIQLLHFALTRLLPPRQLPKLNFDEGIPAEYRTLVVVPTLLGSVESIQRDVQQLEIRYLANPDENLAYALATDYVDAPAREMPADAKLISTARSLIDELNARHGSRFCLFHRDRVYCKSEGSWMGWERKRGKLEQLNSYLLTGTNPEGFELLRAGDPDCVRSIRFVITLDADTQMPPQTARRMVQTLAHPLNRPILAEDRSRVLRGYSILQPRVTTSLPSATGTLFSRLFTDSVGTDPYTHVVSDVYQDLVGEGSYHGKGIYDLRAFSEMLDERFPESHLLSHDLIEGNFARVGTLSDVELLDLFPQDYDSYSRRQHRWIRGDWQICDWLRTTVPTARGSAPNTISAFGRWKIFDNLRRSQLQPACVVLLCVAWLFSPIPRAASIIVGLVLLLPAIAAIAAGALAPRGARAPWGEIFKAGIRALIFASIMPHQALISIDAIGRVLARRRSGKLLLEWETAQDSHARSSLRKQRFLYTMSALAALSVILALIVPIVNPIARSPSAPFLAAWIISPLLAAWLATSTRAIKAGRLTAADSAYLRRVARQTWHFFEEFVGPDTNWLPPDNYQEFADVHIAFRTSPTNIGLAMVGNISAWNLGYIGGDLAVERTVQTLNVIDRLEKHEGNLLNWYDITNLKPLLPAYVSMVDSGNMLGLLWALSAGLGRIGSGPAADQRLIDGLSDTLDLAERAGTGEDASTRAYVQSIREAIPAQPAADPVALVGSVRHLARVIAEASAPVPGQTSPGMSCWVGCLRSQIEDANLTVDRYLRWIEVLAATRAPGGSPIPVTPSVAEAVRQALHTVPSLQQMSTGTVPGWETLLALENRTDLTASPAPPWLPDFLEAAHSARWLAGEALARIRETVERSDRLADAMRLKFLYDPVRRLFYTGYNVSDHRMDPGHYDLLASEARLGSFVSICRGEVPTNHWWALGRPFGVSNGRRVLLSWSGTMFEYLMPLLLTRSYDHSLLSEACYETVECHRAYGAARGIPWGISEAAFSALDAASVYQYRAFGVPGLGMKRGLEDDLVVAPYATALALAVQPQAAAENLRRLEPIANAAGRCGFGFYESVDYTRQKGPQGERGVLVAAYFAHHQGMSLLALDNAVNENAVQELFHSDPRVRACETLLFERVPGAPKIARDYVRDIPSSRLARIRGQAEGATSVETPDTPVPMVTLLSNGSFSTVLTNAGGGYSRWKDVDITRWRSDPTRDNWGTFVYLRDTESGTVWSAGDQPISVPTRRYTARFSADHAELRRRDHGIDSTMHVVVSPDDNCELRLVTLVNRSMRPRQIELTTYAEIALAAHAADRAHPAFAKLFVETFADETLGALYARRRPRAGSDPIPWAVHLAAVHEASDGSFAFETDRSIFLGRHRTSANPAALRQPLTNSQGAVLDPVFAIRRRVRLEAGQKVDITIVTGAGGSREEVNRIASLYSEPGAFESARQLAWTHAQLELRHLRITEADALRYQQLAGYLLFPHASMRPAQDRLLRSLRGQSALWAYGISGDLPIVLVTISDADDVDLVREILLAHSFWHGRGLTADLIILCDDADTYEQPLTNRLRKLAEAFAHSTGIDQPGGVHIKIAAQVPEQDRNVLAAAARIVLSAARGTLARQLTVPAAPARGALAKKGREVRDEPSPPLPFMDLPYFNGLGGFTRDGSEYAIYLGPGDATPMPWINVMANPRFGATYTEAGSGYCWFGNSQSNRLTAWSNDPVTDPPSDALYIRDDDLGVTWSPTPLPIREADAYRTRHGQGYSIVEHNSHALEQELTTFVPVDDGEGDPVRVQILRLVNRSSRPRRLTITFYAEWTLGVEREETQTHISTSWSRELNAIVARNPYHPDFGSRSAFVASSVQAVSYTGDRTAFLGRNGSLQAPEGLLLERLNNRVGSALDPCAALQATVRLEVGQSAEVTFLLGQGADTDEIGRLTKKYLSPINARDALAQTRAWWNDLLGKVQVETPDLAVNFMLNRWLPYQDLSCRIWGRSAFYQSGGAFGFRDQLQDVMALVYARPSIARAQIVRTAARQFPEGDVQHWWHPPSGAGVRTRISDDLLWLPFVTAHYVRVTGDDSILDEVIPFIQTSVLGPNEHEMFNTPAVSQESATLLEHCARAVQKGTTAGAHGLPLIGAGDWNDGLNRVGAEGHGESVWLAWFLVHVLRDFAELQRLRGGRDQAALNDAAADALVQTIESNAWDGGWYLRAFYDDGTPLGSHASSEAIIDSLPQSWSVIAQQSATERSRTALAAVDERLVDAQHRMVRLFTPAFDKTDHDPGYIKGYLPGVRENGGQYTHGSLWVPLALARCGMGTRAVEILQMMNPVEHAREPMDVERYKVEPYVVAADVYALSGQEGRGGWTWYTGSAGWMYRVWIEEIFGFARRGSRLTIDPSIHAAWDACTIRYQHGRTTYVIQIENPEHIEHGVHYRELNGIRVSGSSIGLVDDGGSHTLRVVLGKEPAQDKEI